MITTKRIKRFNVNGLDMQFEGGSSKLLDTILDGSITNLTEEDFSPNLVYRSYAFYMLPNLKTVKTGINLSAISEYMFRNCSALESVDCSNNINLTSISAGAFHSCSSLTKVDFSNCSNLATIGNNILGSSTNISLINFSGLTQVPTLSGKFMAYGFPTTCQIVIPDALYDEWITATNWSSYASNIVKQSEYVEV